MCDNICVMLSFLLASAVLWQGPALAGDGVAWTEQSRGTNALRVWTQNRGVRVVYRGESLAVMRPFAVSGRRIAFERSYPSCPPPAGHVCPEGADAVIGPLAGPFRPLTRARTCFLPGLGKTLALDGRTAAYVQLDCTRQRLQVVVGDVVVRDAPISSGCCRAIAVAGRYVAWSEGGGIVVRDWVAGRTAYRARIAADFDFDLQRDGKVAVAFRSTVAWLSPSLPLLHLVPMRGRATGVHIAGDRIAFERVHGRERSALVVAELEGGARTVATFTGRTSLRGFDFDGLRVAWASDRVTARRVDCPPPGEGRPCVRRVSGVTSIWRRALRGGPSRLVARLRYADAFGR
jgi:hypothetical protein